MPSYRVSYAQPPFYHGRPVLNSPFEKRFREQLTSTQALISTLYWQHYTKTPTSHRSYVVAPRTSYEQQSCSKSEQPNQGSKDLCVDGVSPPKTADIEEYFRLFGDPIEHNSLCKNYKQNPDAKAQLDRIRERLGSAPMMAPPAAPKYDVPSTRSISKRKASDDAEVEEPTTKKRGPGRPSAEKRSKKAKAEVKKEQGEVLQSFEAEIVEKTHHTAEKILNANKQLSHDLHPRQIKLSRTWVEGSESFQGLLLAAHSAENLSTTLQTFVSRRGTHLSSAQRIGIERYREERRNGRFGHIGPPEDEEAMGRYYEFFNDIFFCGSLEGLCVVKFYREVEHTGLTGLTTWH
jgi:hypothetical protein